MKYGLVYSIEIALTLAGATMLPACSHTPDNPPAMHTGAWSQQSRVPGEYLVTLAEGADARVIADLYGHFGIKGMKDIGRNIFLITLTEDPGPAKMEELRGQNVYVKAVQPNFAYRLQGSGTAQ